MVTFSLSYRDHESEIYPNFFFSDVRSQLKRTHSLHLGYVPASRDLHIWINSLRNKSTFLSFHNYTKLLLCPVQCLTRRFYTFKSLNICKLHFFYFYTFGNYEHGSGGSHACHMSPYITHSNKRKYFW
jgi:hypothetical protein